MRVFDTNHYQYSGTVMMAMWENVKCAEGRPNCGSTHRTFSPVWHLDTMDALSSISNPYAAAFFDFDENVHLSSPSSIYAYGSHHVLSLCLYRVHLTYLSSLMTPPIKAPGI